MTLSLFEWVGVLTHLIVLFVGLGSLAGLVPLARGRRAGLGLVLMALSMVIMIFEPRWHLGVPAAVVYALMFLIALWLLLGPAQSGRGLTNEKRDD